MFQRALVALLILLSPVVAFAQPDSSFLNLQNRELRLPEKTVQTLPSATSNTGKVFIVTDGQSASDCATGGGSSRSLCRSSGTSWESIGGSSGGGGDSGWTDGGTNVYATSTGDMVGIGTTTPSSTIEAVKQSSNAYLMLSATAAGDGDVLIVNSAGMVGINDTTPAAKLNIEDGTVSVVGTGTNYAVLVNGAYSHDTNADSGNIRTLHLTPSYTGSNSVNTFSSVYALQAAAHTAGTITHNLALVGRAQNTGAGLTTLTAGGYFDAQNTGSATIAEAASIYAAPVISSGTGTITQADGLKVTNASITGGGTIGKNFGVVIPTMSGGTTSNYGLIVGGVPSSGNGLIYASGSTYSDPITWSNLSLVHTDSSVVSSSGTDEILNLTYSRSNSNTGTTGGITGIDLATNALDASGTVAAHKGMQITTANGNANTTTQQTGLDIWMRTTNASAVTTLGSALKITNISNTGTFTNFRAIDIGDITTGTQTNTPFSIYASDSGAYNKLTGDTVIGSQATPRSTLDIDEGTGVGQITLDGSTGGCLMIRDTDDAGWTECDVLDGVMTCSIDADGVCD